MSGLPRSMRAALLVDAKCTLGEGATWCASTGRFYWTDIEGARLWRYDPWDGHPRDGYARDGHSRDSRARGSHARYDGRSTSWPMPERLACFALCADPRYLLLGFASHLAFFDLATGETQRIAEVEPGLNTRVNDGRCDRQGRFVFGTKDEASPVEAIGGFYRLNHDLSLERLPLPAPAIANGIAFNPDGTTMYYCDSPTREIRMCDYRADGSIANDRVFTTLTDTSGEPDGSTVDCDGGVWNAQWGGARVVRYGADGVETERVTVPTAQPSCVALGGPSGGFPAGRLPGGLLAGRPPRGLPSGRVHLGTLYITSARIGLHAEALAGDSRAGGVFIATPGRRGLPEPVFRGVPTPRKKHCGA